MTNGNILKNEITINFGDNVWSTSNIINNYPWAVVGVESKAVFNGETGGIDSYTNITKDQFDSKTDYSQAITVGKANVATGHLTINGGFYASPATCVYVAQGTCIINGGTFFSQPDVNTQPKSDNERKKYPYGRSFGLNLYDSKGSAGDAAIYVTGGTFIGFDPADNYAEGDGTNFVCKGFKSVVDGEYTYTVKDKSTGDDNGTLRSVKVYKVVPENDERDGISGTKDLPVNQ